MDTSSDFYRQILNSDPSPNTLLVVLTQMKDQGLHTEVIEECRKAVEAHPESIPLRTLLAESYLDMDMVDPSAESN